MSNPAITEAEKAAIVVGFFKDMFGIAEQGMGSILHTGIEVEVKRRLEPTDISASETFMAFGALAYGLPGELGKYIQHDIRASRDDEGVASLERVSPELVAFAHTFIRYFRSKRQEQVEKPAGNDVI